MAVSRTAGKLLSPREGSLYSKSCICKIISVCCWTPQDIAVQPTCAISLNIPTCRWTLHLPPPGEFHETPPPLTPPFSSGLFQEKRKSDFSMFNLQGMVFTLQRTGAREPREIHRASLHCHKVCQLIKTETFLSAGFQRQEHF